MAHKYLWIVLLTFVFLPGNASAQNDAVQFGSTIRVAQNLPIDDAVCFFCGLRAEGEVNGDAVVFFGNVQLKSKAHHDLVVFFGNVTVDDGGSVDGDLVDFFGSVRLGENVRLGQDLVVIFGGLHMPASASIGQDHVVFPFWLILIPICLVALIVFGILWAIRSWQYRRFISGHPLPPMQ
jgi:hypothetical protein